MKRFLALACLILMLPLTGQAMSTREILEEDLGGTQFFPDVPQDHHNFLSIAWMSDEGTVEGYPDGTFKPDNPVNRAELMKMVVLMDDRFEPTTAYNGCFPDVDDEWFASYICYAKEQGWIDGYPDGKFKPGNYVNRAEAIKIILNAMVPADQWPEPTDAELSITMPADLDMEAWYGGYARFAIVKELVDGWHVTQDEEGNLYYHPADAFTRKEVAEMIFRIMLWQIERVNYASTMADSICYIVDNQDGMTDEELKPGVIDIFEANGFTEEEMDLLTVKYENDAVVQANISDMTEEMCGSSAE